MKNWPTEKTIVLITITVALIFSGAIAGTIFEVFDDPKSRTSTVIQANQTYFTGIIALVAALITVGGLYMATHLPIRAETARLSDERARHRVAGATIIVAQLKVAMAYLLTEKGKLEKIGDTDVYRFSEIPVPDQLKSFEVISTQPIEVGNAIAEFLANVAFFSGYEDQTVSDKKAIGILIKHIDETLTLARVAEALAKEN